MILRRYSDQQTWSEISKLLPERSRMSEDNMPEETYWDWEGNKIHIDCYPNPKIEPENFSLCPILLAHPGDDRWTPTDLSLMFFNKLRSPKHLVMLEGAGHFPTEQPGLTQLEDAVMEFIDSIELKNIE